MMRFQPRALSRRVLVCAGLPLTAAFFFWGQNYMRDGGFSKRESSSGKVNVMESSTPPRPVVLACSSASTLSVPPKDCDKNARAKNTTADSYFQNHGELPLPSLMHVSLPPSSTVKVGGSSRKNILVVGDVHGCFDELIQLHQKAVEANENNPFEYVILVGDMCNKGPESARVVRFVRLQENWLSVRGNHDDGALSAALGDNDRRQKKKYKWVMEGEVDGEEISQDRRDDDRITLSDEDVAWLSELPYTITIPASYFGEETDTMIVHGGFIPGRELTSQTIETMITIREVLPVCDDPGSDDVIRFEFHERKKGKEATLSKDLVCLEPRPWASVWTGPQSVIFGHDARRGLQRYEGDWAIGLDTGAVYGKRLTGIILPEKKLVSIETQTHSPAGNGD